MHPEDFQRALFLANLSMAIFQRYGGDSERVSQEIYDAEYAVYSQAHDTFDKMRDVIEDNGTPEQIQEARAHWSACQSLTVEDFNWQDAIAKAKAEGRLEIDSY